MMKGILESVPEFFQIIVALGIAVLLMMLTANFLGLFNKSDQVYAKGTKFDVAKVLARNAADCWKNNRNGLSDRSQVCKEAKIDSNELVTEYDITKVLDCQTLPNNYCSDGDCSFCASSRYPTQDRLVLDLKNKNTTVRISYSGSSRQIEITDIGE